MGQSGPPYRVEMIQIQVVYGKDVPHSSNHWWVTSAIASDDHRFSQSFRRVAVFASNPARMWKHIAIQRRPCLRLIVRLPPPWMVIASYLNTTTREWFCSSSMIQMSSSKGQTRDRINQLPVFKFGVMEELGRLLYSDGFKVCIL